MKHLICVVFLLAVSLVNGQPISTPSADFRDELRNRISQAQNDTSRIRAQLELAKSYLNVQADSAVKHFKAAIAHAEQIGDSIRLLDAYGPLGYVYQTQGEYELAIAYYQKSFALKTALKETSESIYTLTMIAGCYSLQNKISEALDEYEKAMQLAIAIKDSSLWAGMLYYQGEVFMQHGNYNLAVDKQYAALAVAEAANDTLWKAEITNAIGLLQYNQGNFEDALKHYQTSEELFVQLNNQSRTAMSINNQGLIYREQGHLDEASARFQASLAIQEKINDQLGAGYSLNHLGGLYLTEYRQAKTAATRDSLLAAANNYFFKALAIRKQISDFRGMSISLNSIGQVYLDKQLLDSAAMVSERSLELAQKIGFVEEIAQASLRLSEIYELQNKGMQALKMHQLATLMNDSLTNKKALIASAREQAKYAFEKQKAIADANYQKQLSIEAATKTRQQIIIFAIALGLILVVVFLVILNKRLRITRAQKQTIEKQKLKVEEQQSRLAEQHDQLEQSHTEIVASIQYAQRLQQAILPSVQQVTQVLPNSFIYFQPKDVVSGDFYWMEQHEGFTFIAAADCTGHGVPGALVSIVCSNALNKSVKELHHTSPAQILDSTRQLVIETFAKSGDGMQDGMDIALCAIKGNKVWFSGANNPLWIARKNDADETYEMLTFTGDKQPVGLYTNHQNFTQTEIDLVKGDTLYLFSDGLVDQFGGVKNKKFKKQPFRKLLLSLQDLPLYDQKAAIHEAFTAWKGKLEQVDDVCVIGVKI